MGLDPSSTKAVLLPVALAGLIGGGLFVADRPAASESPRAPARDAQTGTIGEDVAKSSAARAHDTVGRRAGAATTPAKRAAKLVPVLHAPWGNKLGELGHEIPLEAAPLGPTSFVVDAQGNVHVLDAVNSRVVVFERGTASRTVALSQDTFQDIDFRDAGPHASADRGYVLLDPFTAGSLAYTDAKGRIVHEVPLVGEGVSEPGLVTAIFSRPDGTWVEMGHDYLMRLTDEAGAPAEKRERAEGRFVGAGADTIEAFAHKPFGASIYTHARGEVAGRQLARPQFALPLLSLTGVEGLPDGSVYLGVRLHEDEIVSPFAIKRTEHWIIAYGPDGAERDRLLVPEPNGPEETFREMKAGRDGKMYAWTFTETGVDIYRREP